MQPFTSCYLFENELSQYGLPTPDRQDDIMNLVELASAIIDEACGRIDGDGNGSLAFTTYTSRILLQTRNRNLMVLPMRPVVGVPQSTVDELIASGGMVEGKNYYYSGVQANTITQRNLGTLSGIISASGRYGYTRQDMSISYPDLFAFINPLNLVTMFGGPAPWVPMDISNTDYDNKTGELWIPAGLQLQRYSEVLISWNAGWDPRIIPRPVKLVCAAIVKNAMMRGGATALMSMNLGRAGANMSFGSDLLDPRLDQMLVPYKIVRAI